MERRRLGKTDMRVSVLGFGGAETGFGGTDSASLATILNQALDAGLNVIDTAECYGTGEEMIGKAAAHRRQDFFLFTKCGHASGLELPDWDPKMLEQSIDRSLKRLQTDCVDLLQLHSCSAEILKQGDAIDVLRRAQSAGKTRYIGYSGDRENADYAVECGAFDTIQTSISIADQQGINTYLRKAYDKNIGVIVKRPIANAIWLSESDPDDYCRPYWERLRELEYDFLKEGVSTAISTALRFTLSLPGVHTAIVGTAKLGRWTENAKLLEAGPLPSDEIQSIQARWNAIAKPDWSAQT